MQELTSYESSSATAATEAVTKAQFFIPAAVSLQERRPRTLKHGDTFGLFDHNGDALGGPNSPEGLFDRDTRYLSKLLLTIDGLRPMLLSSTVRDDNATLTCDLTNPDFYDSNGRLVFKHDQLHLRRSRFLWNGACHERIAVRNFGEQRRKLRVEIAFAADYADLFEIRGARRSRRGEALPADLGPAHVRLGYRGLDGVERTTTLTFNPVPAHLAADKAVYVLDLAPGRSAVLVMEIGCDSEPSAPASRSRFFRNLLAARRDLRTSASRAARIVTSNDVFNELVRRSVSDLYMLMTDTPEGPYPYAGIPWFSTAFGRDALITAFETLWLDPEIARGVLRYLATNQAQDVDPDADAEPGKILHEIRQGEMAALREVPFKRYYGSIDATPLFVMLAGAYWQRTGDRGTLCRLWPSVRAALDWILEYGDRDGDGFVEYQRRSSEGLVNQGWKDSDDSVFHEDGSLARGAIALAEVQAYVYAAWQAAATMASALGKATLAVDFQQRADALRNAFDADFYDDELGTYVLALDGDKRRCRVRSSNAGHVLFTGLALPSRAASIVNTMMAPASFGGWGIRTVPTSEARFNPISYHNGSVWPHDNALIAAGFARYGFTREANRLFEGLFAASTYVELRRLPELFCGFSRKHTRGPTFYPVACMPQAWAAAAPLLMLQASLGLGFDPQCGHVTFSEPTLPAFLDEVVLKNISVADGSVDIALRRSGRRVTVDVLARRGPVRVITTN